MPLAHMGFVELPPHVNDGGFDHAAVYGASGRIYVAHTANDAIDVIDIDPIDDVFHVNVMAPPQIVVVAAGDPLGIRRVVTIPHAGPHGLDIDVVRRRRYTGR